MRKVCIVALSLLVACSKKDAAPVGLYCEGGVINGRGGGGECVDISPDGTARLESMAMTPFVMRRDGKSKSRFVLLEAGSPAGTIEVQDGDWITVTLTSSGRTFKMRSDAPGALI